MSGPFTKAHTTDALLRGLPIPILHSTDSLLAGLPVVSHSTGSYLSPVIGLGDINIFVNGIDRTDWFIYPFKRMAAVGGTPGQLSVTITNAGKADNVVWRPAQFDRIIVWVGTYLWFNGQYWYGTETRYKGTQCYMISGTCLTYESRMDKIMMRQQVVLPDPVDPAITVFRVGAFIHESILLVMQSYFGTMSCNIAPFGTASFSIYRTWTWSACCMLLK